MSISFRCGDFDVVWKIFWNNNYLFEDKLLQHFLKLRKPSRATKKLSRSVYCAGLLYSLESGCLACFVKVLLCSF